MGRGQGGTEHWELNTGWWLQRGQVRQEPDAPPCSLFSSSLKPMCRHQNNFGTKPFLGSPSLTHPPAAGSDTLFCTRTDLTELFFHLTEVPFPRHSSLQPSSGAATAASASRAGQPRPQHQHLEPEQRRFPPWGAVQLRDQFYPAGALGS